MDYDEIRKIFDIKLKYNPLIEMIFLRRDLFSQSPFANKFKWKVILGEIKTKEEL